MAGSGVVSMRPTRVQLLTRVQGSGGCASVARDLPEERAGDLRRISHIYRVDSRTQCTWRYASAAGMHWRRGSLPRERRVSAAASGPVLHRCDEVRATPTSGPPICWNWRMPQRASQASTQIAVSVAEPPFKSSPTCSPSMFLDVLGGVAGREAPVIKTRGHSFPWSLVQAQHGLPLAATAVRCRGSIGGFHRPCQAIARRFRRARPEFPTAGPEEPFLALSKGSCAQRTAMAVRYWYSRLQPLISFEPVRRPS